INNKVFYTESEIEKNIIISEFNYHPSKQIFGIDTLGGAILEFIEIKNIGEDTVNLTDWNFEKGIDFIYKIETKIAPGSFLVISSDTSSFRRLYGFTAFDQYNGNLNNAGEKLVLSNPLGDTICYVNYNKGGVWYEETDGMGFTMVYNGGDTVNSKSSWQSSSTLYGTPGKDEAVNTYRDSLQITEVLANSEDPYVDAIEIYNPTKGDIDISGWYLTDEKDELQKWQVPEGTIISSKGNKVFYEGHYVNNTLQYDSNEFGSSFSLSSGGETVYLLSADSISKLTGLVCIYKYEPTEENTSFGNYVNESGEVKKVQLDSIYLGMENLKAKQSPVIFKTIMYHPFDGHYEFIELINRTDSMVSLYEEEDTLVTWKVDGIDFEFPEEVTIDAGESIYLVEKEIASDQFRGIMNLTSEDKVYNYYGRMSNNGEAISIQKPVLIDEDTVIRYKYATMEKVKYNDTIPWPVMADGLGSGLSRIETEEFSNDHLNWDTEEYFLPVAIAGENRITKTGATINLDGSRSFDMNSTELNYQWEILSSPAGSGVSLSNSNTQRPIFTTDISGNYVFSLTVGNGEYTSVPSITSVMAIDNRAPVAAVARSITTSDTFDPVEVDGRDSYDPDFDELTYAWEIIEAPEGSDASLKNAGRSIAEISPDKSGRYRLELTVSDGEYTSTRAATVNITAEDITKIEDNNFAENNIMMYPNPVRNRLNIRFILNTEEVITTSLYDLNGRMIMQESQLMSSGKQTQEIN
ncbi:lamin tail domain-containing protein, partial [Bacteroidota bacterium]